MIRLNIIICLSITLFSIIEQTKLAINDLVKYIESGSSSEAVLSAKYLAQSRANVEFNLISHNDNEENETKTKKSKAEASPNILQFVSMIYLSVLLT
jgi:hypothetical protein